MLRYQSISRHFMMVPAAILCLGGISALAKADIVGFDRIRVVDNSGNNADFGDGTHISGFPGLGRVTWDYEPIDGRVEVTARVTGRLYYDGLGSGCARLIVKFQDSGFNTISSTELNPDQFCGPGFNANDPANQRTINVSSPRDDRIRRVLLVVGAGSSIGSIIDKVTGSSTFALNATDIINNGKADFGNLAHAAGTPLNPGSISLRIGDNGRIGGRVSGTLFWDSFSAGCARAIIDFKDVNNVNLSSTSTIDECGPNGGNALLSSNRTAINVPFDSADLFKVRLQVGTVVNNTFVGTVTTRTYSYGSTVGIVDGIADSATPSDNAVATVGEPVTYGVNWVVPEIPELNWHSLDIMDVRLVDNQGEILQVRWDEAANTFSQYKPGNKRKTYSAPVKPGKPKIFGSPTVSMHLKNTEVVGSGPTGPSVLLNLNLRFKPKSAGRSFNVEVLARDDSGNVQGWDKAGTITAVAKK